MHGDKSIQSKEYLFCRITRPKFGEGSDEQYFLRGIELSAVWSRAKSLSACVTPDIIVKKKLTN